MFEELMGLPAHPLIVHVAVVFGPLLVASVIVYGVIPPLRKHLGWVVILLSIAGPFGLWFARWSGEALERRQIAAGAQGEMLQEFAVHQNFGNLASLWGTALGVLGIATVLVCTSAARRPATTGSRALIYGLVAVSVVVAAFTGYYVFETGHSGASMVWS
jgi:formate hydrogenlyase subunit 3/multisubunit Na+/H+ antiporter MnhD subunit